MLSNIHYIVSIIARAYLLLLFDDAMLLAELLHFCSATLGCAVNFAIHIAIALHSFWYTSYSYTLCLYDFRYHMYVYLLSLGGQSKNA